MADDDLIRVAVVATEPEAEIAVSVLKSEGIDGIWRQADSTSAVWGAHPPLGPLGAIEILVLRRDSERAYALLEAGG